MSLPTEVQTEDRMNRAFARGLMNGIQAFDNCEPMKGESRTEAAFFAEHNARQFAGHLPRFVTQGSRVVFDRYNYGVACGIAEAETNGPRVVTLSKWNELHEDYKHFFRETGKPGMLVNDRKGTRLIPVTVVDVPNKRKLGPDELR